MSNHAIKHNNFGLPPFWRLKTSNFKPTLVLASLFFLCTFSILRGQTPGGVTGLKVWLKAHDGFTPSSWADRSGAGNNFTQTNAARQPFATTVQSKYNYYPAVDFGNITTDARFMVVPNGRPYTTNGMASSIYLMLDRKSTTTLSGYHDYIGFGNTGTGAGLLQANTPALTNGTSNTIELYPNLPPSVLTGMSATLGRLHMEDVSYTVGTNQTTIYGHDGMQQNRVITITAAESQTANGAVLGAQVEEAQALMTEIICFEKELTGGERDKVRSYLALKYGITLSSVIYGQYLNSAGTQVYSYTTNTGYNTNIFGLMRDNGSALNQKVSKSIANNSLIIGTNQILGTGVLPLSNVDATRASLTNLQAFIVGDNGVSEATYTSGTCSNASAVTLSKIWRAQNTGSVGVLHYAFDFSASGVNQDPVMIIYGAGGVNKREIAGTFVNGTQAVFAAQVNDDEFFTFGGVRASGSCPTCTNGSGTLEWRYSTWTGGSNGPRTYTVGSTGVNMTVQFLDPNNVKQAANPRRRGKTIELDRNDPVAATGYSYTGQFTLTQAAKPSFVVHAVDRWGKSLDEVEIIGDCGGVAITPTLNYTLAASKSTYTITGNKATALPKWSGYLAKSGMVTVSFDRPVTSFQVIWKTNKPTNKKNFQRSGLGDITLSCPYVPACSNTDNIVHIREVSNSASSFKTCEQVRLKYTIKNTNCTGSKTVSLTDNLPAGMVWVDESLEDGSIPTATVNSYGGTANLNVSNITLALGQEVTFYCTAKFTNQSAASYSSSSSVNVSGGTTIPSNCGTNNTWTTTVGTAPSVPNVTLAASKTCYSQNEDITYTVTLTNPTGSAMTGIYLETGTQDLMTFKSGGLSATCSGTANAYADGEVLQLDNMTVPANGTCSFNFVVSTSTSNTDFPFYVNVSGDPNDDCSDGSAKVSNTIDMVYCTCVNPVITTQPVAPTVCAGSTGTATVAATGTTLTYQWEWSSNGTTAAGNAGETGNNTATITLGANNNTYYRCKVTSNGTCNTYSNWFLFKTTPLPVITTQPSAVSFCAGSTGPMSVVATGTGLTYQWEGSYDGVTAYGNAGEGGNGTATITLETGSHEFYRCKVTNAAGCFVYTNWTPFTLLASPTLSSVAKTNPSVSSCPSLNDGTITVTATGADLQYSKDNGANWQASNSFTGLVAGNYTIKVKNNTTGCEVAYASNPVVLNASSCGSCPTLTNTASNNVNPTTCGGSNGSIKICGLGASSTGWTISYDKNGTAATSLTALTADASGCLTISSLTVGAYTNIKVTHATSCPSGSGTVSATLTDPAAPSVPTTTVTQPTCTVATATITVNTPASGVTYSFDNGVTFQPSNIKSGLAASTTYQVVVKDNTSLCTSTATAAVVNAQPATPVMSSVVKTDPSVSSCPSLNDGTITVTATGANLQYSKDNGATWQASNSFTGLVAGNYTIKVKNNTTSCEVAYASNPVVLKAPSCAPTTATFTFNCGSASAMGTLTANGTTGQTGTLTIPMTSATAGSASFAVAGTGFIGSLSTTLTAGQASVAIPITYDGTGTAGSRTLTVTSAQGTGSCTPSVSVASGATCATPTVGGTAAYAGGTLCNASNIGTASLSGQTGNVVRWETSINGGTSWSPLAYTDNKYNFINAANGQQYRAVLNNGGSCLDANSAPATIATSAAACTSTCDNTTGNVTFTVGTPTLSGFEAVIIMTNASGVIQYATAVNGTTINGVAVGDYLAYRVVYDPSQLPLPTLTVGTNITGIGGACAKFTNQVAYKVCVATAPDLTTTIGQPTPALVAGQPSNLPITVANIGTAPAPGIITTTITLPSGVTAPTNFTSNGWTCSTTAPTVTCTNPGPINAGASSLFNVPITPDATTVGTKPIFNANTNPVTGETNTGNNNALPLTPTVNVQPANCNWTPGAIGK
jgi:hypothetical protein